MKQLLFVLVLLAAPLVRAAEAPTVTFYVQLIRGTDSDVAPAPNAHLIGPKLSKRLHTFKWKNYWEISRETLQLNAGAKVRKRVSPQREVELSWPADKKMLISIYTDGKVTRKREQSINTAFYIAGGDKEEAQSWFIVVRQDNPDEPKSITEKLMDQDSPSGIRMQ